MFKIRGEIMLITVFCLLYFGMVYCCYRTLEHLDLSPLKKEEMKETGMWFGICLAWPASTLSIVTCVVVILSFKVIRGERSEAT